MKYYLSMPYVGCPWVSKGLKGQACFAVHCFSFSPSLHHAQLSKHSPSIDPRRQRRTNTWPLIQRVCSAQRKQAFLFYHLW